MDNKNLPAYPQPITTHQLGSLHCTWEHHTDFAGLTKLEMVSAMCLQGLLSSQRLNTGPHLATLAAECANALLNHLSNTEK